MPNHSPQSIANEFLKLRSSDAKPDQLWVQKLTYFAHGWTLALTSQPLSNETPEAWDNGPVFRSMWDHILSHGFVGPNCELCFPGTKEPITSNFTPMERDVIDHVWRKYGIMAPRVMSDMTHTVGTPWYLAYIKQRYGRLDQKEIQEYYIKLGMAGRAAAKK